MRDLVNFARQFDLASPNALRQIAEFATSLMTGVGATNLLTRVQTIRGGRARTPATPAETASLRFPRRIAMGGKEPTAECHFLTLDAVSSELRKKGRTSCCEQSP